MRFVAVAHVPDRKNPGPVSGRGDDLIRIKKTPEFKVPHHRIVGEGGSAMMCFMVCSPLSSLLDLSGVPNALTKGESVETEFGECNHYWLELPDGRVLDPTADQFNGHAGRAFPAVYLGAPADIHRATNLQHQG